MCSPNELVCSGSFGDFSDLSILNNFLPLCLGSGLARPALPRPGLSAARTGVPICHWRSEHTCDDLNWSPLKFAKPRGGFGIFRLQMKIINVRANDYGQYICEGRNSLGVHSAYVTLYGE